MLRQWGILGVALLAGCVATAAAAADFEIIDAPEIRLGGASVAQGWYIRGDLGYAGWVKGGKPSYTVYQPGGTVFSTETFDTARFSEPFSYGAGMGYQFNNFLRADLTTDFFSGKLSGRSDVALPCSAAEPAGTECGFNHKAGYSAINVMANGYVDLGTFAGFTPYVGAGAGVTNLRWDDLKSTPYCIDGSAACSGTTYASGTLPGYDSWRFTYALMAGASYDITERVKLDLGYRFTDIDGGKTFGYGAAERGWGASGAKGHDEGFQKHEIRAGIRITTW
ncbi:outer membrane protein [Shinella pollutisoli]|uniref:Outer membrane protein n=1 Tax=Shinella pollutisoli TaxID=2250594 RepID=A0ABV7DDQ3_9HYPH|nr:outer membrane beta-barrel protein [Shinella pollutisoli]